MSKEKNEERAKFLIRVPKSKADKLRSLVFHAQHKDPTLTLNGVLEDAVDTACKRLEARYGKAKHGTPEKLRSGALTKAP
jgi:hypothetical protein